MSDPFFNMMSMQIRRSTTFGANIIISFKDGISPLFISVGMTSSCGRSTLPLVIIGSFASFAHTSHRAVAAIFVSLIKFAARSADITWFLPIWIILALASLGQYMSKAFFKTLSTTTLLISGCIRLELFAANNAAPHYGTFAFISKSRFIGSRITSARAIFPMIGLVIKKRCFAVFANNFSFY